MKRLIAFVLSAATWACPGSQIPAQTRSALFAGSTPGTGVSSADGAVPNPQSRVLGQSALDGVLGAVLPGLVSGASGVYLPYLQGSGSAINDMSGNGRNCNFAGSPHTPLWSRNGNALLFNDAFCTGFDDALNGAQTVQLFVSLTEPMKNDGVGSLLAILSDGNTNILSAPGSGNGQLEFSRYGNVNVRAANRLIGNTSFTLLCPSGQVYINAKPSSIYLTAGTCGFGGGPAVLGNVSNIIQYNFDAGFGASFTLYGMLLYNRVLSPSELQQNDQYVKAQLLLRGISFPDTSASSTIFAGDSNMVGYGTNYSRVNALPGVWSTAAGITDWDDIAIYGQLQATVTQQLPNREYPMSDGNSSSKKLFVTNGGTNDIATGASAPSVLSALQGYCSALHGRYPGSTVVVATIPPRQDFSPGGTEAQRQALNASLISGQIAGTLGCDGLVDIAGSPIGQTRVAPNAFSNSSGADSFYFPTYDGVHFGANATKAWASLGGCTILDAQGRMNQPCWISVDVPSSSLQSFTGPTQAFKLLQLFPGWQVCGMQSTVTTAFAGDGWASAMMSVGDSEGTQTQYLPAQSLTAAGTQTAGPISFASNSGVVTAYLTSTGADLNKASGAGMLKLNVCVVHPQ